MYWNRWEKSGREKEATLVRCVDVIQNPPAASFILVCYLEHSVVASSSVVSSSSRTLFVARGVAVGVVAAFCSLVVVLVGGLCRVFPWLAVGVACAAAAPVLIFLHVWMIILDIRRCAV